ncbi:MFS general substrate transporter [Mycena venus]|uniref:MFS general substrate transporter n=1 Tax=Mycena venus TaxID=2733690 RepID=A0A8H6XB66_9AGAR|nr:MFS general substrate transporter [Mycena venus]
MSLRDPNAAPSQVDEIELAFRVPLPPSTSTFFLDSEPSNQLASISNHSRSDTGLRSVNEVALPPADGGFGAWSFLAAAFTVEAIVWGFPDAYGVFLNSYLQDPRYATQKSATSLLPLIGTLSSGIIYCSAPIINPIATRYPHHRRKSMWLGAALCSGTLFGASYATEIFQLIILQGVLYAIGGSLLYLPCISYMSEWFIARRGMANGILFAGTAAGGLLIPLVLPLLTEKYGLATTLRILGIAMAVLIFPILPFIRGRLPQTRVQIQGPVPRGAPGPQRWFKQRSFWILLAVNTLQGSAYFVPIVYLPTFAHDLQVNASKSAVTVALLNAASVVGRLSMGYLSDTFNPWMLAFSILITTSATSFILWGVLSYSFAGLVAFGIAYGTVAGGWTCLWTGFVKPLAKDDLVMSTTLYGYLLLSRGVGNIVSTPISARLYSQTHLNHNANATAAVVQSKIGFEVGDGRFETMIVYVGTCFAGAAGVAALGWVMDVRKRREGEAR